MHNVKILDCTLRDGGYYNNWDFSTNLSKNYLNVLSKTSVDVIEIGFRKPISNIGSGPRINGYVKRYAQGIISKKDRKIER